MRAWLWDWAVSRYQKESEVSENLKGHEETVRKNTELEEIAGESFKGSVQQHSWELEDGGVLLCGSTMSSNTVSCICGKSSKCTQYLQ